MRNFPWFLGASRPHRERAALMSIVLAASSAVAVGCGGAQAAPSGAALDPTSATAPSPTSSGAANTPTTTTTVALGEAGDLQGTKLAEASAVASTHADAAPAPKGPHQHDAGRGPSDIRALIVAQKDETLACYDAALPNHPGIEGDVVIAFTIDPKGSVTQTALDTSRSRIAEPTLTLCLSNVIKRIQFAASPGGFETKASYPFNFHPRHEKRAQ